MTCRKPQIFAQVPGGQVIKQPGSLGFQVYVDGEFKAFFGSLNSAVSLMKKLTGYPTD